MIKKTNSKKYKSESEDSSDSEESEKLIPVNKEPKKRGRPRKNIIHGKSLNVSRLLEYDKKENNGDIILHLKVTEHNNSSTQTKTKTKKEKQQNLLSIEKEQSSKQDKITAHSESSNESATSIAGLLNMLKEKENIINILSKKIKELSYNKSDISNKSDANIKTQKNDLKLINYKSHKIIIADKTDIACWWCTYQFKTVPCFIPEKMYNKTYYVFGCFCSYNCALAYILDMKDGRTHIRTSLLKNLHKTIFEKEHIECAPPREILKKFGGIITIEDFRNSFSMCTKQYKMKIPGLIPLISSIEVLDTDIGKLDNKI